MTDDEMLRRLAESGEPWAAPLRGEHELYPVEGKGSETICGRCGAKGLPYCLRRDLGALVRAATALGYEVRLRYDGRPFGVGEAEHAVVLFPLFLPLGVLGLPQWTFRADTPESAAIRALYAAKGG